MSAPKGRGGAIRKPASSVKKPANLGTPVPVTPNHVVTLDDANNLVKQVENLSVSEKVEDSASAGDNVSEILSSENNVPSDPPQPQQQELKPYTIESYNLYDLKT